MRKQLYIMRRELGSLEDIFHRLDRYREGEAHDMIREQFRFLKDDMEENLTRLDALLFPDRDDDPGRSADDAGYEDALAGEIIS